MFAIKSTYLNSAYLGPMPLKAKQAVEEMAARILDPAFLPHSEWRDFAERIRRQIGELLGGVSDRVSINSSVSEVISHVADALGLGPQDEVILLDGDYPSMILPWMVRAERNGFRICKATLSDFMQVTPILKAITPKTRLVGCSQVMFNTGIKLPVEQLATHFAQSNTLFLTDVSQSFGGLRLSSELVKQADVIAGVGYKWLLGPYGSAFGYFSERALEKLKRTHASWLQNPHSQRSENLLMYSTDSLPGARKFDRGQTHSYLITKAWSAALELIAEIGLVQIEKHNSELVQRLIEGLPKSFSVEAPEGFRSNIVCIRTPNAAEIQSELAKKQIDVSVREGALRISPHFFNTSAQIDRVLEELR